VILKIGIDAHVYSERSVAGSRISFAKLLEVVPILAGMQICGNSLDMKMAGTMHSDLIGCES